MKKIILPVLISMILVGCSSGPKMLRGDNTFFAPVKSFAYTQNSKYKTNKNFNKASLAQRELASKDEIIDLLRKENKDLRERINRIERQLSIIQSSDRTAKQKQRTVPVIYN